MLNNSVDNADAIAAKFLECLHEVKHFIIVAENEDGSITMWTNNTTPKDRLMYAETLRDHAMEVQYE